MRRLGIFFGLLTAASLVPAVGISAEHPERSVAIAADHDLMHGHLPGGKAHGSIAVHLVAEALDDGVLTATIDAVDGVEQLQLSVVVRSGSSGVDEVFDAPVSRGELTVAIDPTVRSGAIDATVTGIGTDGDAVVSSDRVWYRVIGGEIVTSEIGLEDLGFRVDELLARDDAIADTSDQLLVGHDAPIAVSESTECAATAVCAAGVAEWTDRNGVVRPIVSAYVDLVERLPNGRELVRATVLTDSDGIYRSSFPTPQTTAVFVRLRAAGPSFEFVVERAGIIESRALSSGLRVGVAPGSTIEVPFRAGGVNARDTVFSLHAAMTHGVGHIASLRRSPLADVQIVFPSIGTFYDPGLQQVHMLELDRWDWDVMLHEFGHHVAAQLGIEQNPGGRHSGTENLGDRLDKSEANRLAWGEGWPTYFAVSALFERGAASLDIPGVGDTVYQDTEDTFIFDDLEDNATLGEDNELTVASIMWDLYDSAPDGLDRIALGARKVWDALDHGDPTTLSEVAALFAPDRGARSNDVNCVLSQTNVSPSIAGTAVAEFPTSSPTVSWSAGNGGRTGRNDSFTVEYRDAATSVVLHAATTRERVYRASDADWAAVVSNSSGAVNVSVVATAGRRSPLTGPYRSCLRAFEGGPATPVAELFVATTPARLLDTRVGRSTVDGRFRGGGRMKPGEVRRVQVAGRGAVPDDARAAIVNITAAAPQASGFVVAFDCTMPVPLASSLNFGAARDVANEIVVALSESGELCLSASSQVDLVLDVAGYVDPASPLVTVTPARLLDTRRGSTRTVDGRSAGAGPIGASTERRVVVAGRAGIPTDAVAAIINVAAVKPSALGFVTVSPCTDQRPLAASLNVSPGRDRADEIVAPLDDDGAICVFSSGRIDAVIDVVGFVPAGTEYVATVPARFVDTRVGGSTVDGVDAASGRLRSGRRHVVQIAGRHGVPNDAVAATVYVTSVQPRSEGYLTVWPCDESQPLASSVNHEPGADGGNELLARLDDRGRLCVFTFGDTDITVDVAGYLTV